MQDNNDDSSLYRPLPSFYSPGKQKLYTGTPYKLALANLVCAQSNGKQWWLRMKNGRLAEAASGDLAAMMLLNEYCGRDIELPGGAVTQLMDYQVYQFICGDMKMKPPIKRELPIIEGTMMFPGTDAQAVQFQDKVFANTWCDTLLAGDISLVDNADVRPWLTSLLAMIREGLADCDGERDLDAMLAGLYGHEESEIEFRFIMSWLAAGMQEPGINLQTNLCLLGQNEGCGKGTLGEVMRVCMGGELALTANADEFKKGWSNQFFNRLLICLNEVKRPRHSSDVDWMLFAKQWCQEKLINANTRYVGFSVVLNIANFLFTSNHEDAFAISENDRRMAMIRPTRNLARNLHAYRVQQLLLSDGQLIRQVMQAFVGILRGLAVEKDLIARPIDNSLRQEAMIGSFNEFEWWLLNDDSYDRDAALPTSYWRERYNLFSQLEGRDAIGGPPMQAQMVRLMNRGLIEGSPREIQRKDGSGKNRQQWWFMVPSSNYPKSTTPGYADSEAMIRRRRMETLRKGTTEPAKVIALPPPDVVH